MNTWIRSKRLKMNLKVLSFLLISTLSTLKIAEGSRRFDESPTDGITDEAADMYSTGDSRISGQKRKGRESYFEFYPILENDDSRVSKTIRTDLGRSAYELEEVADDQDEVPMEIVGESDLDKAIRMNDIDEIGRMFYFNDGIDLAFTENLNGTLPIETLCTLDQEEVDSFEIARFLLNSLDEINNAQNEDDYLVYFRLAEQSLDIAKEYENMSVLKAIQSKVIEWIRKLAPDAPPTSVFGEMIMDYIGLYDETVNAGCAANERVFVERQRAEYPDTDNESEY